MVRTLSFIQSIIELERQAAESGQVGSLHDQIDSMQAEINKLKGEVSTLTNDLENALDENDGLRARVKELENQIPDLRNDPDPYGLHGVPLSHRLLAIGFPMW